MKKQISIDYDYLDHWSELDAGDQSLVAAAREAMETAYAPYSEFRVGASLLLSNGTLVKGSNQENIAYPSGLCAERVALFYAGANFPDEQVETLCIIARGKLLEHKAILSPCGGCRQVMVETQRRQKKVYRVLLVNQDESVVVFDSAVSLLPLAFGV